MAFGNLENREEHEDLAEINIVPLVDVMLVLLIIFMVAAPLSVSGIKVNLPSSNAKGAAINESKVILSISKQGRYFFDHQEVQEHELGNRIHLIFKGRQDRSLYIRADESVAYGKVVGAMSAAKIAGVGKLAMLTKKSNAKGGSIGKSP